MKRQAADRPNLRHRGWTLVALCAAAVLVLAGGCGEFNESSDAGGLTVRYGFAQPAGTSSPMIAWDSTLGGDPVLSLVVGAIVITGRPGSGPNGEFVVADADTLTPAQRDFLKEAAKQSLQFLEVVKLPSKGDTVEFRIPPRNAGNWQLMAIGLRHSITVLDEMRDDSPIWYGFIGEFLNGKVKPKEVYPVDLVLRPWCGPQNKNPPGSPPCP